LLNQLKNDFKEVIRLERLLGLQGIERPFWSHSRKLFKSVVVMDPRVPSTGRKSHNKRRSAANALIV
jgi:hypothetical protein